MDKPPQGENAMKKEMWFRFSKPKKPKKEDDSRESEKVQKDQ